MPESNSLLRRLDAFVGEWQTQISPVGNLLQEDGRVHGRPRKLSIRLDGIPGEVDPSSPLEVYEFAKGIEVFAESKNFDP